MVRLQAAKVLAKLPTQAESAKGVVLRFDFVNNHDTRVAMYVIFATALAGFIILLVQFVDLLTKDPSTHRFQKNTDYVWNVSVGGLCLVLMTAVLSVFACRVFKAHRHKKQWRGGYPTPPPSHKGS
ncbi:hypothetical protein WJX82_010996 [Trebouxia sp. C0006]